MKITEYASKMYQSAKNIVPVLGLAALSLACERVDQGYNNINLNVQLNDSTVTVPNGVTYERKDGEGIHFNNVINVYADSSTTNQPQQSQNSPSLVDRVSNYFSNQNARNAAQARALSNAVVPNKYKSQNSQGGSRK